jgi:hypothetical protein
MMVLAQFVIPAKAGIQIFLFCSTMDAHFRGHDNFLFKLSHYPNDGNVTFLFVAVGHRIRETAIC